MHVDLHLFARQVLQPRAQQIDAGPLATDDDPGSRGEDIDLDSEIYTKEIGMVVETPADADSFLVWKAPYALTITDIDCITGAATSAVIDIQECTSAGASCTTVDATITCDSDGAADDGTLTNGAIDSGDWIKLDIGTVTGTVGHVAVTVKYTPTD